MNSFISNIKNAFSIQTSDLEWKDRGGLVDELILIAGFAIAAILFVNWMSTAILNKTADTASCIEGSNAYTSSSSGSETNCKSQDHSKTNSYTNDSGYKSRFGSK